MSPVPFTTQARPRLAHVFYLFKGYFSVDLFDTLDPADFSYDNIGQLVVVVRPDLARYHMFAGRGC